MAEGTQKRKHQYAYRRSAVMGEVVQVDVVLKKLDGFIQPRDDFDYSAQ